MAGGTCPPCAPVSGTACASSAGRPGPSSRRRPGRSGNPSPGPWPGCHAASSAGGPEGATPGSRSGQGAGGGPGPPHGTGPDTAPVADSAPGFRQMPEARGLSCPNAGRACPNAIGRRGRLSTADREGGFRRAAAPRHGVTVRMAAAPPSWGRREKAAGKGPVVHGRFPDPPDGGMGVTGRQAKGLRGAGNHAVPTACDRNGRAIRMPSPGPDGRGCPAAGTAGAGPTVRHRKTPGGGAAGGREAGPGGGSARTPLLVTAQYGRGPSRRTRRPSCCRTCRARRRTIRSRPSACCRWRCRPARRRSPPTFRRPARRLRPWSTA